MRKMSQFRAAAVLCVLLPMGFAGAVRAGPAEKVASAMASCAWQDKLAASPVTKLPEAFKVRTLQLASGAAQVSVVEGFRLTIAEEAKEIFANVKVEQSEADRFEADRDAVVANLRHILATSKGMETPEPLGVSFNGFEGPMINRAALSGSTLALIALFHEKEKLILTIYLENAPPEKRSFQTKDEWNLMRDRLLVTLTECAAKALQ
jgi:hypothetical protein